MLRSRFAILLLLLAGCHSTSEEAPVADESATSPVFAEEKLPAEWEAFTQVNSDYFLEGGSRRSTTPDESVESGAKGR